jgi:hypothetical protein
LPIWRTIAPRFTRPRERRTRNAGIKPQCRKLPLRTSASSLPLVDESALAPAAPFYGKERAAF